MSLLMTRLYNGVCLFVWVSEREHERESTHGIVRTGINVQDNRDCETLEAAVICT